MNIKKKHLSLAVKALCSIAFFSILFSFINLDQLAEVFSSIQRFYLALSLLLTPVMLTASCLKWKVFLEIQGGKVSFRKLMRIYMIGYFFSNLLPSTVGGDVVRTFYSAKEIDNYTHAAVAIFNERFSGILFLLLLVVFAPLLNPGFYRLPYIYLPAIAAAVILLVIVWVWRVDEPLKIPDAVAKRIFGFCNGICRKYNLKIAAKAVSGMERSYLFFYRKVDKFHLELMTSIRRVQKNRIVMLKVVVLTVLFYFLTWVNVFFSFRAFGVETHFWQISALIPTILFLAHLPVTMLGNVGFFESVFVFYFMLIGVAGEETLAMGLLLRLKMILMGLIGLVSYIIYKHQHKQDFIDLKTIPVDTREMDRNVRK